MDQETKDYLETHKIADTLDELLNEVLRFRPRDPLTTLAQLLLGRSRDGTRESMSAMDGPTRRSPMEGERRGGFTVMSTRKIYENQWIEVRQDEVTRPDGKV